jgi:hypothetical protein
MSWSLHQGIKLEIEVALFGRLWAPLDKRQSANFP